VSTVTVAPDGEYVSGRLREAMQGHPLGAFFVIAFATTWAYEIVVFGLLGAETIMWSIPATFGPAIAAVWVTHAVEGKPGLRSFLRRLVLWRVHLRWYLLALVVMPAVVVAGYVFMPDAKQNVDGGALAIAGTYVSMLFVLMLLGGGQEEPGWRGFALPRMQERWHPLKASVFLGALWGLWHLPLFVFLNDYDNAGPGFLNIAAMFVTFTAFYTVGLSVVLAWLVNNARGSILLAMLAHGSVNAATNFAPESALPLMVSFMGMGVLAIVIAVVTRGQLGYAGRKASGPSKERATKTGLHISPAS
jgi:membrane protease YdiL (CAAX protease family)